jgi:hypothetical protein
MERHEPVTTFLVTMTIEIPDDDVTPLDVEDDLRDAVSSFNARAEVVSLYVQGV